MIIKYDLREFIRNRTIWLILVFGFFVGTVFVFLVPPWMHYDEPGHFEYAWLIANRPGLPYRGDYDQTMRREVSASILEKDIASYTGMQTDPLEVDQRIEIFNPQVEDHSPTYYLLAALPLFLFRHSDITFQLYIARFVSLSLFLGLVWVGYRVCVEVFGRRHPVTWMVPLFLVTLPSFVDIMTAVNNDAAANLAFGLFVWAGVLVVKQGLANFRLPMLLGAVALCLLTKSTTLLAVPLSLIVVLLALVNKKGGGWAWLVLGIGVLGLLGLSLSWRESAPAYFYTESIRTTPRREIHPLAPWGEAVIVQEGGNGPFYAMLAPQDREALAGQVVTLGAWIWADEPVSLQPLKIQEGQVWIPPLSIAPIEPSENLIIPGPMDRGTLSPISVSFSSAPLVLTSEPVFYTFSVEAPPVGGNISWVSFPTVSEGNRVYWDGIVLVPGAYQDAPPPTFTTANARMGMWDGDAFTNMIRNGSGESAWLVFSPLIRTTVDIPNRIVPSLPLILSFLDFKATAIYYRIAGERIFRTFWSVFGWANVALYGQKPYRFFLLLTLLYLVGVILAAFRKTIRQHSRVFAFFGLAIFSQLVVNLFRGVGSWFWETYIPVGRYLYPVIIPVGIVFMTGANQLVRSVSQISHARKWILYCLFAGFQLGILLWAIISNLLFYMRP